MRTAPDERKQVSGQTSESWIDMVLLLLNWVQQKIKQVSGSNPPTERAIKFTTMARNECERTGVWRLAVRNKIFLSKSQNYPNYCLMRMKIEKGRNYLGNKWMKFWMKTRVYNRVQQSIPQLSKNLKIVCKNSHWSSSSYGICLKNLVW